MDEATEGVVINAADWQARATHIRQVLSSAPDTAVAEALGAFLFGDDAGKTWTYNGAVWMSWDGTRWSEGTAPANLRMQPFLHEAAPAETSAPAAAAEEPAMAAAGAADMDMVTADAALTGSSAMTSEMPAESVADEPSADTMADETRAMAEADHEPAIAEGLDEPSMSLADAHEEPVAAAAGSAMGAAASTELASDRAEATRSSATPAADKAPEQTTLADLSAESASTADLTSNQPSISQGQPASSAMSSGSTAPATAAAYTPGAFKATHTVPMPGMGAWTKPDPSVRPEYQLAPRTELMVVEMLSSGWARVAGSNGWTGWVDGRQLQPMQTAAAAQPQAQAWQQPAQQPQAQSWQQPAQQPQAQSWQQPAQQPQAQSWQQPAAQPAQPQFRPTHAVPPMGMPAWAQPNPSLPPQAQLAPGTQLTVAEWSQSGWARVVASNGWSGWVDGRMLVTLGQSPYQR